ncbi:MAG TPA: NADH-ubiquinone oxidoreductase-F iron-sulfur binding region domain-containing protein [Solirubrobacteraceae bacterium]|jgi:NADH:ubiquinone oxidoreductase subunit F (NADH-binding)|nr:NADH-ubiquinone oxidoreductase-F iron-sulfur binding region domain-containing protein [Solirubrobacteraceae bacterium]
MSLPRLLAGLDPAGALSFDAHVAIHGELAPDAGRRRHGPPALIEEVRRSGLGGRGGAGFPTATKLDSVLGARGRPIVVVNGCEGEPASEKDLVLLERAPHLVIDGAVACAHAVGADQIVFAVDAGVPGAKWALQAALAERPDTGRRGLDATVVAIPPGYVSGHESAVVNFVNRGVAKPTAAPPMVFERGVARRPTLVTNAETAAHVALIARYGADWFREVGTDEEPGSALVTVGGAVAEPGVFEIEYGSVLGSLLHAAGGTFSPLRAILVGGYCGSWIDADQATSLRLAAAPLRAVGASFGAGVIVALPESACPVAETVRVTGWLAGESAGQCGPCVHGLAAIAGTLADVADGRGGPDASGRLARWAGLVTARGACAHPDGVARFVTSSLRVFADEFADHAHYGRCAACARPAVLRLPERLALAG